MFDTKTAIQVDNICKIYRIGTKDEIKDNFAEVLFSWIRNPIKNYNKYRSLYQFSDVELNANGLAEGLQSDIIWALKDVSFTLSKGEVLGIIGKNGAGKSTLLKVLCRITDPTKGRARVRGRISSLLEVGTGFHNELTGRENVYLNGTILGMTKIEINKKFDEIVQFSGVEKFIDTPVKRYSSGMKVRLAFSVAAHLEPEILIIDEVLAVGDADFQKKCLNKMETVGNEGRTVLFVSHNMGAVSRLCSRCILIQNGRIVADDKADLIIDQYLNSNQGTIASKEWNDPQLRPGGDAVSLSSIKILNRESKITEVFDIREPVIIEITYNVLVKGKELMPNLLVWNNQDICIFVTIENDLDWRERSRPIGTYCSRVEIPGNFFTSGRFYVDAVLQTLKPMQGQFYQPGVVGFQVLDRTGWDTARGNYTGELTGLVRPLFDWKTNLV